MFCKAARQWAMRQSTLNAAWRSCQVGSWMAWWLYNHTKRGDWTELAQEAITISSNFQIDEQNQSTNLFLGYGTTPADQQRFADYLRANYWPSGNRRKVKT